MLNDVDAGFAEKIKGLNDGITISQTVKLFSRYGKAFTKTMIQNYVRVGVLPPPVNNRYYTKNHILMLYMIDDLKNVFSLDEIKQAFASVLSDFYNIDMRVIYNCYALFYANSQAYLSEAKDELLSETAAVTQDENIRALLLRLSMMSAAYAAKRTAAGG